MFAQRVHVTAGRPMLRPAKLGDFFSDHICDHLANHSSKMIPQHFSS
jgi:hypothetical protein